MKVLIIKLSSIGDVVHTLPALYSLKKGFEAKGIKAEIDWLVEEEATGILAGNPLLTNVVTVKRHSWGKNLGENLKTAGYLKTRQYDLVIDFQGLLKSGVWVFLSRGKRRVGFENSRELSHVFLNDKAPAYDPERHAVERYMNLARYCGGADVDPVFRLDITDKDRERVWTALKEGGVPDRDGFFVMVARARWATKLWSDASFAEAAKEAVKRLRLWAVIAGGEDDRAGLDGLKELIGEKAVNLAGRLSLKELAALMDAAEFVLTVDSGPMHVAAATGKRVIALFGPTSPGRTGPYGKGHIILQKRLDCSPCLLKKCRNGVALRCMKEITVDEVLKAMEDIVKGRKP